MSAAASIPAIHPGIEPMNSGSLVSHDTRRARVDNKLHIQHPQEDFFQVLPNQFTPSSYAKDAHSTHTHLYKLSCSWPYNGHRICCPYPIHCPASRTKELENLHEALTAALLAIVQKWWTRPDFQAVIPVTHKIEEVLRRLDIVRPYAKLGSIRPDFLVPELENKDQKLKICEINARFAFNGFFLGIYQADAVEKLSLMGGYERGGVDIPALLAAYGELFDPNRPVAFVTHREQLGGHFFDIALAKDVFPHARLVRPTSLRLIPGTSIIEDDIGSLDQFILELHQDELEALDDSLIFELGRKCWNDLRTIYLVHDKRMLGLLRRELDWLVAGGDITPFQAQCLRDGLLETYSPSDPMFRAIQLAGMEKKEVKDMWVLKKCMSGKGDGMVFGKDVDKEIWNKLLDEQLSISQLRNIRSGNTQSYSTRSSSRSSSLSTISSGERSAGQLDEEGDIQEREKSPEVAPYLVQRYLKQKRVNLVVHTRHDVAESVSEDRVKTVSWYLVGTMLCINNTYLGNPFWRTNENDIIAVGTGGLSVPSVTSRAQHVPAPAVDRPLQLPFTVTERDARHLMVPTDSRIMAPMVDGYKSQVAAVRYSLTKYGLAVVDMNFEDMKSEYMVNLIYSLGLGEPISHSDSHGILWDVKPVKGMTSELAARSMTMESFPWHTDCSYESSPPRYFALHIIHRDRFGGGVLRLLSTETILTRLSTKSIEILQMPIFRIRVPNEFLKGEGDHIVAPILSTYTAPSTNEVIWKIRFRKDIVTGLTPDAEQAIEELDGILGRVDYVQKGETKAAVKILGGDVMRDRTVVLLDNARWLHARSGVRDERRWLRRVRWGPEEFVVA